MLEPSGAVYLGTQWDPNTDEIITLRSGPYGAYLQLENRLPKANKSASISAQRPAKFRTASLLEDTDPANMTAEEAVGILAWPRWLGEHPTAGQPVAVHQGKYGPYVRHAGVYAPLPKVCQNSHG